MGLPSTAAQLLFLLPFLVSSAVGTGGDIPIFHVHGGGDSSPSAQSRWADTVMDLAHQDSDRLAHLSSVEAAQAQNKTNKVPIASGVRKFNKYIFVARTKFGTPANTTLYCVPDTASDDSWIPCDACANCTASTFSTSASSSFVGLNCSAPQCALVQGTRSPCPPATNQSAGELSACTFNQSYGDEDSSFSAVLSQDSLTLGESVVSNFTFGCIKAVAGKLVPPEGLLGLGRGSMSLMSQAGSLYSGIFSYCLPSFKSSFFTGSLKLGPAGQPKTKTTPLLSNPRRRSLYYLNLMAVSVGKALVQIPDGSRFNPGSGAGTVIDSGSLITRFERSVYESIRAEFQAQVGGNFSALGAFDTCFPAKDEADAPALTLHFEGMSLKLPTENTLIHRSSGEVACLAMAATNLTLNVIGSYHQQNLRVVFDVPNSRVGMAWGLCN